MQKTILIGGQAGEGIAKTSFLFAKALANLGYYVFNYRDYPSLIRGGHNFNVVKFSDSPVYSHEKTYDVIVALDQLTIDKHEKNLVKDGWIIGDKSLHSARLIPVDVDEILKKFQAPKIAGNSVLIGALFKHFNLPLEAFLNVLEKSFTEHELEKSVAKAGYDSLEARVPLSGSSNRKFILTGNEAIGAGALAAGLDLYIAYPMTPATPLLHWLAARQLKYDILVAQLENEIAVINAALGASYAGAMVMVGTSGGGFALMSEAMSLQGMSEVPLVVYLAERPAPSTCIPTYTAQGDLKFAVNVGHGEFPRVVVAPGDAKEAFYRTIEAFYLAYKYRVLSIILGDKHLGESHYTFSEFEKPSVACSRFLINPQADYKSYLLTDTGVSPRAVPGEGPFVRASSYEHDEYGYTTEDPEWAVKMNDKRIRKDEYLKQEIEKLNPVSVYGKGGNLIVGWGSTKGAIVDALSKLENFRFMQISYIRPFPAERVKKEVENSENVVLVENNVTGLLGQILTEQTGVFIDKKILKYDGRPFTPQDVIAGIKKVS